MRNVRKTRSRNLVQSFLVKIAQNRCYLHLHRPAVDELARGCDVVKDDGRLLAAVEDDALALARHPHRAPLASEHVHSLVVLDLRDGNVLISVESTHKLTKILNQVGK